MDFTNLDTNTFEERLSTDENGVLLDVRTPSENEDERIPGGLNINLMDPDFVELIAELDKSKNYYVYCRSGARSASACQFMKSKGFKGEFYNLEGGIMGWSGAKEQG